MHATPSSSAGRTSTCSASCRRRTRRGRSSPTRADKRAQADRPLLERPEFADFWALKWADLLRNEERTLDRKGVQVPPLDPPERRRRTSRSTSSPASCCRPRQHLRQPAGELLPRHPRPGHAAARRRRRCSSASGSQCAQCHNHPFDRWTQDDYYGLADVFARVDYKVLENRRTDDNDKHEFVGEQIVYETRDGDVKDPRGDRPVKPRLLGHGASRLADDAEPARCAGGLGDVADESVLRQAQVNRIWFHLMGRGLVDPVDDFRADQPAEQPRLLDALAEDFVDHTVRRAAHDPADHDVADVRACRPSPNETNARRRGELSHALPRRLTAEQLLDAQHQVTGVAAGVRRLSEGHAGRADPGRAGRAAGAASRADDGGPVPRRLRQAAAAARLRVRAVERHDAGPDVPADQRAGDLAAAVATRTTASAQLIAAGKIDEQIIEELYWPPCAPADGGRAEGDDASTSTSAKDRRKGLEDVPWALLNAKEFVLRSR